ncbi:MAG: histidine phosphatase super family protein [Proteobacteria bacterium]|nr:histidine phosphatase super family protein [Pseudomonadota bacterium]
MDLLLWRHAEAEDGIPDLKRKLTPRGEQQAQQMAAWLKTHAPENLRIVASPAKRCQQTAQALDLLFQTDLRLAPGNSVNDLLAVVDWPDGGETKHHTVLVVGHQPTLGRTAALLLSGIETYWSIKKGSVWWFSNRTRLGETQTVLRAVVPPELA